MGNLAWAASVVAIVGAVAAVVVVLPRRLIGRSQDRLADRVVAASGEPVDLLTRAELVTGRWRRLPGVLGLAGGAISFDGVFGESWTLATSRISKIITGRRMASGRLLFRMEVLRITGADGVESEFVITAASAAAWRSHLGMWAMAERTRDAGNLPPAEGGRDDAADVVPGRR